MTSLSSTLTYPSRVTAISELLFYLAITVLVFMPPVVTYFLYLRDITQGYAGLGLMALGLVGLRLTINYSCTVFVHISAIILSISFFLLYFKLYMILLLMFGLSAVVFYFSVGAER